MRSEICSQSANVAASGVSEAKSDWDFILESLDSGFNAVMTKCLDKVLTKADHCLPDSVTLDNELHYMINYCSVECCYHACASFMRAHQNAQIKVATMFGD